MMSPRTWKFSAFTFIGILVLFLSFEYSFKTITSNVSENNSRYLSETDDHHNTTTTDDDHSTSTEHSSSTSLFGILSHLDPLIGTMSFVIIAAVVVFVETMFHYLNEATHDTPFHQIIPAVEKELMIAGCTAFAFKIIVNAAENMNTDWYHSLEYAGNIITFHTLFFLSFIHLALIYLFALRSCSTNYFFYILYHWCIFNYSFIASM